MQKVYLTIVRLISVTMNFVSQKEAMATDDQGTADHEVQQECGYHEEGSKLSFRQDHQGSVHEEIPKAEKLDTDAQKGDDPERASIQQLLQPSEDPGFSKCCPHLKQMKFKPSMNKIEDADMR